jgi:hypothetical protein
MHPDAWFQVNDMARSSAARREAEQVLAGALGRSPSVSDPSTRAAVHAYVDVLVREGSTPEAAVIAVKELLAAEPVLFRYEPEERTHLRAALVSECIARYFQSRGDDMPARAPRVSIPMPSADRPLRAPDAPG